MKIEILSIEDQVSSWQKAARKMKWKIDKREFTGIKSLSLAKGPYPEKDTSGPALFYGFGDDGKGNADSVFSGKMAWDYACKVRKEGTWQSPHIDFERPDSFRLRPGAPQRPKGFYFAVVQTGESSHQLTVCQARSHFNAATGLGPEGFQLLCVTHSQLADMMNERKMPFMFLADYDVAPYGFNDFFDSPHLFSSNRVLGLGIGNIDQVYPGFSIPTIKF